MVLSYLFLTLSCAQPVPVNVSSLTSDYGTRTWVDGSRQFHDGIDIEAPEGTPIKSISGGKVIFAGVHKKTGGNVVVIREQTAKVIKTTVLYGHLEKILVTKGQAVKQGKVIGTVGSTGKSTGPHLHLSVWQDNLETRNYKNVNPEKFFKFCKYKIRKHPHF